jgi:hypothetical protein
LARILKPGGTALYLHEPGCQPFIYQAALRRVNAKRPEVPEDVLRYRELVRLAREAGLKCEVRFAPTLTNRGPIQSIYYFAMQKFPLLQHVLPTCLDLIIHKPARAMQAESHFGAVNTVSQTIEAKNTIDFFPSRGRHTIEYWFGINVLR